VDLFAHSLTDEGRLTLNRLAGVEFKFVGVVILIGPGIGRWPTSVIYQMEAAKLQNPPSNATGRLPHLISAVFDEAGAHGKIFDRQ
jgi:hypothetical protein